MSVLPGTSSIWEEEYFHCSFIWVRLCDYLLIKFSCYGLSPLNIENPLDIAPFFFFFLLAPIASV